MQYLLAFLVVLLAYANADLYSSIADMQSLVDSQRSIPDILYRYIETERRRLDQLMELAEKYDTQNEKDTAEINDISNPLTAFLLIKRKMSDWNTIKQKMLLNNADSFVPAEYGVRFPTEEDLAGAAIGLLRLQDTCYVSAGDCFEIAKAAYNDGDYYHTIMWAEEAKLRLEEEEEPTAKLTQILEYLSFSLYKQGNAKHALKLVEELAQLEPNHPRAKGNIKWYEDHLAQEGVKKADMRRALGEVVNQRPASVLGNSERAVYEALCRNEVPVSEKDISKLYCYYKRDRPYLVYAPIKVEIKRFNPLAVLFKEVISDEEIELIEELSIPKLARATVHDAATGKLVTATYRISKSAWLKEWEHEVVERVNKRIDMMTNLDQDTAEELQVQNYGIGGHYDPHFDHARKEESKSFESLGTGNRIATVLFYMTEPRYGGGTVFTDVKSTVLPTKNDALFWYNLRKHGEGDTRTRHAGCPVLVGLKWVSNKWIHERGNEIRRRCGLKLSDGERFVGDLGFGPEPRTAPNLSPDLSKDIFNTI
ncbi:unnamed protein product [Heligmosomoides polygyrus]|uniref:procollagen-proline 4-dioxygenase n=1 Tax=Heligmosomoides polygyrus TaxID=6339 RepID=A0A3P7ZZI6_HELPZ|nr:unnamed protein product [Heligmosomoides polygyrus]